MDFFLSYLKVMAEAEFKRLGAHFEVSLLQVNLGHEEVSISMRGTLVQAMLETALSRINVTCNTYPVYSSNKATTIDSFLSNYSIYYVFD